MQTNSYVRQLQNQSCRQLNIFHFYCCGSVGRQGGVTFGSFLDNDNLWVSKLWNSKRLWSFLWFGAS